MDFPAAPPSRCKWSPRCGEGPTSARIKDHSDANVLINGRFLRCSPVSLREGQPRIDTDQEATTKHTKGTKGTEVRVEGVSEDPRGQVARAVVYRRKHGGAPEAEDVAWSDGTTLLVGSGSKLLRWTRGSSGWTEIADYTGAGLRNITRLAVSPDGTMLAFVADPAR